MWSRTAEVMLGFWLAASPFIFSHSADEPGLWWNDFGCAFVILALSLVSFWSRARRAHLLNILVGVWLVGFGYLGSGPAQPTPASQNQLLVGLVLLMLAIIPSQATLPPPGWRRKDA